MLFDDGDIDARAREEQAEPWAAICPDCCDIDARAREEQAQHEARRAGPDDDAIGLDKYLMTSLKRVSPFPA
jgi:hypothetical protein